MAFESIEFLATKLASGVAITGELARFSDPQAELLIQRDLVRAGALMTDSAFLDGQPAVVRVRPASIVSGAPTLAASGTSVQDFKADAAALIGTMSAAGCAFGAPFWIMTQQQLAALDLGDASLVKDGKIAQWPVLTSTSPPIPASTIVLVDASEVLFGDLGFEVDSTQEALVELANPAADPATASTTFVSLWQAGLTALRLTRYVHWDRAHGGSAGTITGCSYGLG